MDMDEIVEIVAGAMCLGKECRRNCPDVEHAPCPDSLCSWREDAERILSALSARGLAVVKGWQPISTAPRDGTPVLLWLKNDIDRYYVSDGKAPRICIGFWGWANPDYGRESEWHSVEAKEEMWGMGNEYTGPMMEVNCIMVRPTHWMPLPARPSLKEGTAA